MTLDMRTIFTLIFSSLLLLNGHAQAFKDILRINQADTFILSKAVLTSSNELVTASLLNHKLPVGSSGILGEYTPGQLVLRKLDSNQAEVWRVDFPSSKAFVFDMQLHNNNIIFAGAFYDNLVFPNSDTLSGIGTRSNTFIASFDLNGNYNWAYSSSLPKTFSQYISSFFILDSKIYYPYITDSATTEMQVLNLSGDSLSSFQLSQSSVLVSDIEVDSNDDIYFSGTCDSHARFAGDSITHTQQNISYMTFLAKTDSDFNQLWAKGFRYITFDIHPEIEVFNNGIAFLYNHVGSMNANTINYYALSFYNANANLIQRDSVADGTFSHMYKHKTLLSNNNMLYLSKTLGFNKFGIFAIDNQYHYHPLSSLETYSVKGQPDFTANNKLLFLTYSFNDEYAILNNADTIWNTNYLLGNTHWAYQQLILQHTYDSSQTSTTHGFENKDIKIFPNPARKNIKIESDNRILSVEAYTLSGQLVYSKNMDNRNHQLSLNESGLYLLRITTETGITYRKLIIK